jgi:murein DD-endopeptidase MepM/ murein hydrolase activator NlpD
VDKEIRNLKRIVRSFNKDYIKINKKRIASRSGRRLWRAAAIVSSALVFILLLFPPFRLPVDGAVTSGFFLRRQPESSFAFDLEIHKGIDLSAHEGAPVFASAPGRVKETGFSDTYGNFIILSHLLGFETRYAHLSETVVGKGDIIVIRSLKPIGAAGSTGRSTAPHLHFELRWVGWSVPPKPFLLFHGIRKTLLKF